MKQIAYVQHGTSAFMQAFVVVVHLKTDPHKNQLFDVKKKKKLSDIGRLHFHTQNMVFHFFPFRPKKRRFYKVIIIIIFNPLTARVVGSPQMILQPLFLHFSLFSTTLWDLPNYRPVHSLMLSSHLILCLPCLLPPFTVPCKVFWPDLMNGRHDHTTAVCVSL